jgi:hypothetical protein
VRLKYSFLFPRRGLRRRLDLYLPDRFRIRFPFTAGRSSTTELSGSSPTTVASSSSTRRGHTRGHVSVVCLDDAGRRVLLAGDATDSLEQLLARRHDPIGQDLKAHAASMNTVLAHLGQHPTIYLPSHDPESAARLQSGVTSV